MNNDEIEVTLPSDEEIENVTKKLEVTLPSYSNIVDDRRITIFTLIGMRCYASDYSRAQSWLCKDYWCCEWLTDSVAENGLGELCARYVTPHSDSCRWSCKLSDTYIYFIRPVIKYDNLSDLTSEVKKGYNGVPCIEFGEYPQDVADKETRKILERSLKNGKLSETGKTYAFGMHVNGTGCNTCKEYVYNGKKYVRVKNTIGERLKLSTGGSVGKDGYFWVEVSPIKWHVDEENKCIVSDKALISGLKTKLINGNKKPKFIDTNVYCFLNNSFLREIIPSKITEKTKKEVQKEEVSELSENTRERVVPETKIEKLISDIYKYLEGNPNREEILKKLEKLTNEYNDKLDEIKSKKLNNVMTIDTYESVTSAFELKLEMMLVDVKKHHELFKEYFDMIAILGKYMSLINGNKGEEYTDGLVEDLDVIASMCLPFLKEEDANAIRKQLINIFNNEKKEITNYIDGKGEVAYKTIDEMIIDLRKKIHPVLGDLSTSVNKRDVEVEIRTSVSKIISGLFDKPRNEALSFYLVEINNIYTNINALIDKLPSDMKREYKKEILDIMNMDIDYSRDFNDVADSLKRMWLSLNKVLYRINDYLGEIDKLDFGHVDLNKFNR